MRRFVSLLFFLFQFVLYSSAQGPRLYTAENGLPGSQVNCLFQDSEGYIWIGSQDGLFHFDGVTSEPYLLNHSVSAIFEDSLGKLWAGSSNGLYYFDESVLDFVKSSSPEDYDGVNFDSFIVALAEIVSPSGSPELLVCTSSTGCFVLDLKTGEPDLVRSEFTNHNLSSAHISSCLVDDAGSIWFAFDDGGLTVFDISGEIRRYPDYFVSAMTLDPLTGNVAIGTFSQGLFIYDMSKHKIVPAKFPSAGKYDIRSLLYYTDPSDSSHYLIVGTEDNGYFYLSLLPTGLVDESRMPSESPYDWKIHSMLTDIQGNVWFGVYQKGVLVRPNSLYGFSSRMLPACVSSIYAGPSGRTYVGTDGGGLFVTDSQGRTVAYTKENSRLSSNAVLSVDCDGDGDIWIGTYNGGLNVLAKDGSIKHLTDARLDDRIKVVTYNPSDNNIYVGTSGGGLAILSGTTHMLQDVICTSDNQWISAIQVASDGSVWIGTYDGLLRYYSHTGELVRTDFWGSDVQNRIYAMDDGRNGDLWIGTGDGIVRYNKITARVEQKIPMGSDTETCSVKGVLCADDEVWISTGAGLFRYNVREDNLSAFYAYDGLQGNEFHTGAAEKSPDGMLYFGGTNGYSYFDPLTVNNLKHVMPKVDFTRLVVMNEESDIDGRSRVEIPNSCQLFSIGFRVAEYTNPDKVVYSYMMEDFDSEWHRTVSRVRSATYTNLPHGRYVFKVRAFYEGEDDNYSENSIEIKIESPWFLKWWAFLVYLVLISLVIVSILASIQKSANSKKEKQLASMKEMRLGMFTNMTHEIRTPLSLVMNPLKKLREEEEDPKQRDIYNLMYRNCLRINRIVNQLMDLRKIDDGQMKLHFVETDIESFVLDIMHSFDELASSNNISFTLDMVRTPQNVWLDPGNFDKIVFNILSNAFKFTPKNGRITVTLNEVGNRLKISIFNSGSHIEDNDANRIFERFYQGEGSVTGSGVGLNLSKLLVELHHGTISASNTEEGVVFDISIPCGNSHLTVEEMSTTHHHYGLYPVQNSREEVLPGVSLKPNPEKNLKGKKNIVIVEDDKEALEYLRSELSDRFSVKCFSTVPEAYQEICRSIPDAILTDIVMPGMSGLELCAKVRRNPSTNDIPVIVLTSDSDDDTRKACSEVGADRFFVKPAPMDVLESDIAQVITSRELIRGKYSNTADYGFESVKMPFDKDKLYEKMISVIKENLDNSDFSVDDLSRALGMSRVHLNRKTKELGCPPPSILIKSIRLKQAAYLLSGSNVNVSEVAFRVGFASHSYFTRTFGEYFGLNPKEFVQKYKNRQDSDEFRKLVE